MFSHLVWGGHQVGKHWPLQVLAPLSDSCYWEFVISALCFHCSPAPFGMHSIAVVTAVLTCTFIARAQLHDLFHWWSWIGSCSTKFGAAWSASPWCGSAFSLLILFSHMWWFLSYIMLNNSLKFQVLFVSERTVIGVGFDCNPMIFVADETGLW